MTLEKKLWRLEKIADRTFHLSISLATEAMRAGKDGAGYGVIAQETRNFSNRISHFVDEAKFSENDGLDEKLVGVVMEAALMMNFLTINTMIEITRVNNSDESNFNSPNNTIAVYAEEIRRLCIELTDMLDGETKEKLCTPEVLNPIKSTDKKLFMLQFSIGGVPLVENLRFIKEVVFVTPKIVKDGQLNLRGRLVPIIDCYGKFSLPLPQNKIGYHTHMIVTPDLDKNHEKMYAVAVDNLDIDAIFKSRIGYNVVPNCENKLAQYARECWDATEGCQMVLADWDKLYKGLANA